MAFFDVVIGILEDKGKLLLVERPLDAEDFAGMVGFPGGKKMPFETPKGACKRIVSDETWIEVENLKKLGEVRQVIEGDGRRKEARILVYRIRNIREEEELSHRAFWHDADDIESLEIVPSNISIYRRLYQNKEWGRFVSRIRKQHGEYVQTDFYKG